MITAIDHFKKLSQDGVSGAGDILKIMNSTISNPLSLIASNASPLGNINQSFNIIEIKSNKAVAYFTVKNKTLYMGKCKKNICKKCQQNLCNITPIDSCSTTNTVNRTKSMEVSKNVTSICNHFKFINSCKH